MKDHSRKVSLACPTCGCTSFLHEPDDLDDSPIKCTGCDREFTKAELIEANQTLIDSELDDVKRAVVEDFRKSLKDRFRGNKFIKIK